MHNPASRFLDDLPEDLVDWRRTEADGTRWTGVSTGISTGVRQASSSRTLPSRRTANRRPVPSLSPGDRVVHDSFGMGTVVSLQGSGEQAVAAIDFGSEGVKRLLLRYAPVEKL